MPPAKRCCSAEDLRHVFASLLSLLHQQPPDLHVPVEGPLQAEPVLDAERQVDQVHFQAPNSKVAQCDTAISGSTVSGIKRSDLIGVFLSLSEMIDVFDSPNVGVGLRKEQCE